MEIRPFESRDLEDVVALWRACGLVVPWNDPLKDIERKQRFQPDLFLVGCIDDRVVGCVMAGYEGHRGWLNYVAVDPLKQRQGLGSDLMAAAEDLLRALGCAKINLQVRSTNRDATEFYKRLGYSEDDVVSLGKRLVSDE